MAAVTTDGEEKICFRFNEGLCKNKNCKYVHKIMSEQQKKIQDMIRIEKILIRRLNSIIKIN